MIQSHHIRRLFNELWPDMHASASHREYCLQILPRLETCFNRWSHDLNDLLDHLAGLDGIGLTIASGLIWSVYPSKAVPFDRWTMAYALKENILTTHRISQGRYTSACQKVILHCRKWVWEEEGKVRKYKIMDFVREAYPIAKEYEWSISPE